MTEYRLELREAGKPPREVVVDRATEVGRECDGIVVDDLKASRRHVLLTPSPSGLTVADLGSTNGTFVNGSVIEASTQLVPGDTIRLGGTELAVLAIPPATTPPPGTIQPAGKSTDTGTQTLAAVVDQEDPPPPVETPPSTRPVLDELASRETEAAVVRFRPGTAGESAAPGMVASLRRARRRLAGLGSEPWGGRPQVCLVDPFPDPNQPGVILTSGTLVDAARNEIWMAVTPESPPESPERPLALLFGSALPAAADLTLLLEGYGLHLAELPDPDRDLRSMDLPPLGTAEGELRGAMSLSFVRYLVDRAGDDGFRRLLADARPGRVDATAQDLFGMGMTALEEAWRRKLAAGPPDMKTGQFLRLTARYLRPHARREGEMFVYMLLGLGFTMVFPFAFRRLIDHAIPSRQFSQVLRILVLLGLAFVVSLVAGLRRTYLSACVSGSVVRDLRTQMYNRLQLLSTGWFSRHQQGDVLSRLFSDVGALEGGLSQTLREGLFQVLSLVVSAIVLLALNLVLGVIVLAGAPLIAFVYRAMAKGAQRRSMAVQEQIGSLLGVASENYGAQSVVKAFGLEAREQARFGRASDRVLKSSVRLQLYGGLFGLSVNMVVTALRLVVFGLGAWLILHGHLTVGGLVAFMGLMGEVLSPVTTLTGIGQQIQQATGALVRINEVLEAVPDVTDASDATPLPRLETEIRIDGVGFSYTPERRTLEGIDAVIPAGSRVAFVGPTGAGKSSVLQLLMRFYDPDDGAVRFDGRDVRTATVASLRGQLGVVFQDTFLFDTTIRENIALGRPGATDSAIEDAARAAELHEFVTTLPRGYDTLVGERGGRLSGGQRQRLAIARALLRDPRVLLLDEATSALDARTERLIADTLDRVGKDRTTIAVTHRLTSITRYDRIFVIAAGHLVEQGTHEELISAGGVYAGLWAEQTGAEGRPEAPLDVVGALARIPLFRGLRAEDLELVAGRLRAVELAAGEQLAEGRGQLVLVRRSRARLLSPSLAGEPVAVAQLAPGDAFGLSALLGQPTGAVLRADEPVGLLVLDDDALNGVAARFPSVAAALEGRAAPTAAPAGGRRLSRVTMAPSVGPAAAGVGAGALDAPPTASRVADEIRRASGSYTVVR